MLMFSRRKLLIIAIAMLQLALIPIVLWLSGWEWQLRTHYGSVDQFLFFITETGSALMYALITSVILASVLALFAKDMPWIIIIVTACILLMATQVIKTSIKLFYKEPRPYTSYLVEQGIDLDNFYQEKRSIRKATIKKVIKDNPDMPQYLKKHWSDETGYSFPSGHTAFAVCWLMMFLLVLPMNRKRDWAIGSVIFTWTALMMISRIRFGMHYPIDVFVSLIYVPIFCILYAKLSQCEKINRYCRLVETLPNRVFASIKGR